MACPHSLPAVVRQICVRLDWPDGGVGAGEQQDLVNKAGKQAVTYPKVTQNETSAKRGSILRQYKYCDFKILCPCTWQVSYTENATIYQFL